MARTFDLSKYPPQFVELAERFEKHSETPIVIPIPGAMKAKALQVELICFRAALRNSKTMAPKYPHFIGSEISKGFDGESLIVSRKDKTASAIAVGNALSSLKGKK